MPKRHRRTKAECEAQQVDGFKYCTKCGRTLPVDQFRRSSVNKDGLQHYCKDCQVIASRERYRKQPKTEIAIQRIELKEMEANGEYRCTGCELVKPLVEFTTPGGVRLAKCRDCRSQAKPETIAAEQEYQELMAQSKRRCTGCGIVKDLSEFWKQATGRDGYNARCKECLNRKSDETREKEQVRDELLSQGLKRCPSCKEVLPLSDFPSNVCSRTGRADKCYRCTNAYKSKRRREKPELYAKYDAYARQWLDEHPEQKRTYDRNRRSRELSAEGEHTGDDIIRMYGQQNGLCIYRDLNPYCQVELGETYDVDHIIPLSRGGTNDVANLQLLCPSCNRSKFTRTHDEFVAHLQRIREMLGDEGNPTP